MQEGITSLEDKRKGKPKELLTKKQRDDLLEKFQNTTPENYGYDSDYWSTGILIIGYVKRQYGVHYKSKTSYYVVFRYATFTYHKPGRVSERRDEIEDKMSLSTHTTVPEASPEQNLQEHVWKNGRSHITHNLFIKDIDKTTYGFVTYLNNTKFSYVLLGYSADS